MSSFTGVVRLTVIEATGLKPVTVPGGKVLSVMEPYCVIDFDDFFFGATSTKSKTSNPVWGEAIEETVEDSQRLQLTVFHSSTIPPDNFIAHAHIMVEDLMELVRQGHDEHEVSMEICFSCSPVRVYGAYVCVGVIRGVVMVYVCACMLWVSRVPGVSQSSWCQKRSGH